MWPARTADPIEIRLSVLVDSVEREVFVRVSGMFALLIVPAAVLAGPISQYYLTAGDQFNNWIVQGSSVVTSWDQHNHNGTGAGYGESGIAVSDDVRTLGNGTAESLGSEYTLAGVYTGVDIAAIGLGGFYDGTTDGKYIYSGSSARPARRSRSPLPGP